MFSILQRIKFEDEANQDNSLFNVISKKYGKNVTQYFWSDMFYRVYSNLINNFFCIFIWGEQGTAKSGIGQLIALTLFPDFDISQVAFTNEELRNMVSEIEPNKAVLRDEFQKTFGEGTYQLQATIENYARQLRDRQNSFIYIQPDFMDMKNFHYYLRTISFDEKDKIVTAGLQNPSTNGYIGYVLFDLKPFWNCAFWQKYKIKKDKFVDIVASNSYDKLDLNKLAIKMMENKDFHRCVETMKNKNDVKLNMSGVKNLVYKLSPNLTTGQNNMLTQEIRLIFQETKKEYMKNVLGIETK
jgi:hypothetical protein